jgi:WD40 repeat protein
VETHEPVRTLAGHGDAIYSVAWSPDGKLIASGSYDRLAKLWDAATGKEIATLQDHIDAVFSVAFSPDGRRLATASQDRTVKIWEVATGKRLYTLSDALDGLTGAAFSPDGGEIAAAGYDKTIYVWRLGESEGQLRQSLIADEESILAMGWAADGKTLVTASADGSIRLRNAATLELTGALEHQPDWVESLALSSDGKWLTAGRYDGSVSVYNLASKQEAMSKGRVFGAGMAEAKNDRKKAGSE